MVAQALKIAVKDANRIPVGVKLLVFMLFLRTFGWGFVDPFFSIYVQNFSANYTVVGLFMSLMGLIWLITIIPLIRLTDKVKDARIIKDGEILYLFVILAYIAAGLTRSVPLLIVALVLNGIANPLVVVGSEAYIRKHQQGGEARSFGYYTAFDFLGWIIGMLFGAVAIHYTGLNWMYLWILPSILISFFILAKIKENGIGSMVRGFKKYFHKKEDFQEIFANVKELDPKMIFFLIIAFFDGIVRMFLFVFIPLFALSIDLGLTDIALLMVAMYFPFVLSFFFSEVADRKGKMSLISLGLIIAAISFVLLSLIVDQMMVLVLASLTSLSLAIIRPAYNGAITHLTPRKMLGEMTGISNLVIRSGMTVGPLFTGLMADKYGIQSTFFVIAVAAFVLAIASFVLRRYDLLFVPQINEAS